MRDHRSGSGRTTDRYLVRRAGSGDLDLLASWRRQPHVMRWWGDAAVEPEADKLSNPRISLWIVECDERPFAFIQDYDVHEWTPHPFDYLPGGSRGLDIYIGEPDMVGCGHGARFVRQHVEYLFGLGVPAVGADPHPENLRACRAFEKAGFTVVSGPVRTPWGLAILMDRRAAGRAE